MSDAHQWVDPTDPVHHVHNTFYSISIQTHISWILPVVHLGDDVAAADQLPVHEELRDGRPVADLRDKVVLRSISEISSCFLGRDPGTLKSDIVSKKHPQLICSDLRLSN